jgi:hypothetical protein
MPMLGAHPPSRRSHEKRLNPWCNPPSRAVGDLGHRKVLRLAGASLVAFSAASTLNPQLSKAQDMTNRAVHQSDRVTVQTVRAFFTQHLSEAPERHLS